MPTFSREILFRSFRSQSVTESERCFLKSRFSAALLNSLAQNRAHECTHCGERDRARILPKMTLGHKFKADFCIPPDISQDMKGNDLHNTG